MLRPTLLALGCLLLQACGGERAAGERRLQIAVVPKGTTHEFWKAIHAGARSAAGELGVEIAWKGPQKEDDRAGQVRVVEDFVTKGVDGIVLAPMDDRALVRPCQDALEQGVPVVIIDSDLEWDGRVSFIATDNRHGGVLAARELAARMDGGGKALVMRYLEGSASTTAREEGFLATMRAEFPGIEIVSESQYAGAGNDSAMRTAENLLNAFPEVEGVFCPNESALFGMLRALQQAGRAGAVRLVGFDATEKLAEALRAGEVDALIVQDPWKMGALGVRRLVDHLRGRPVEARIDTGVLLVTRENMDETAVRRVMAPDLSVIGG